MVLGCGVHFPDALIISIYELFFLEPAAVYENPPVGSCFMHDVDFVQIPIRRQPTAILPDPNADNVSEWDLLHMPELVFVPTLKLVHVRLIRFYRVVSI